MAPLGGIPERVSILEAQVKSLSEAVLAGGGERPLSLKETALRVFTSPGNLRDWSREDKYHARSLLVKRGGRLQSSPLRIARWRAALDADRRAVVGY